MQHIDATNGTSEKPSIDSRLRARLVDLKAEFDRGNGRIGELEAEASRLRETLLRISGAIQVIEEELGLTGREAGTNDRKAP